VDRSQVSVATRTIQGDANGSASIKNESETRFFDYYFVVEFDRSFFFLRYSSCFQSYVQRRTRYGTNNSPGGVSESFS
jgi:hypothetical protein